MLLIRGRRDAHRPARWRALPSSPCARRVGPPTTPPPSASRGG